ncbi:MAG: hypothetical protein H3Z52_13545 [archaeon]|nr:hypothetical protein [archaeon]MCP8321938.1 hypothetical protein [archaeon]
MPKRLRVSSKKSDERITIRLTATELEIVKEAASHTNLTISEYVRLLIAKSIEGRSHPLSQPAAPTSVTIEGRGDQQIERRG